TLSGFIITSGATPLPRDWPQEILGSNTSKSLLSPVRETGGRPAPNNYGGEYVEYLKEVFSEFGHSKSPRMGGVTSTCYFMLFPFPLIDACRSAQ
ncbi:MAG: hypothetical protein AB7T38_17365, partial [Nitrospirales bacterium]